MDSDPLGASFMLVTIAELGNKTQIAVIALSAEYEPALLVYLGMMKTFAAVAGLDACITAKSDLLGYRN